MIFRVFFPFLQRIVFARGSWLSFTEIVGFENENPCADIRNQPADSETAVVATRSFPSSDVTSTTALTGADEKPYRHLAKLLRIKRL